jgi:hypothetical protein
MIFKNEGKRKLGMGNWKFSSKVGILAHQIEHENPNQSKS